MRPSSYEIAASVLLSAAYSSDKESAEKHGISIRTLYNYRNALQSDENFAAYFASKKRAFDTAWAEELPAALADSIRFLAQVARNAQKDDKAYRNPLLIQAVAGAMKLCAEVYYTGKFINARIDSENRPETGISGQDVSPSLASSRVQ